MGTSLHTLKPPAGARKNRKRLGRGPGSGLAEPRAGTTAESLAVLASASGRLESMEFGTHRSLSFNRRSLPARR